MGLGLVGVVREEKGGFMGEEKGEWRQSKKLGGTARSKRANGR